MKSTAAWLSCSGVLLLVALFNPGLPALQGACIVGLLILAQLWLMVGALGKKR
jgi:hypothetical protein